MGDGPRGAELHNVKLTQKCFQAHYSLLAVVALLEKAVYHELNSAMLKIPCIRYSLTLEQMMPRIHHCRPESRSYRVKPEHDNHDTLTMTHKRQDKKGVGGDTYSGQQQYNSNNTPGRIGKNTP